MKLWNFYFKSINDNYRSCSCKTEVTRHWTRTPLSSRHLNLLSCQRGASWTFWGCHVLTACLERLCVWLLTFLSVDFRELNIPMCRWPCILHVLMKFMIWNKLLVHIEMLWKWKDWDVVKKNCSKVFAIETHGSGTTWHLK